MPNSGGVRFSEMKNGGTNDGSSLKKVLSEIVEKGHLKLHSRCMKITHQVALDEILSDGIQGLDSRKSHQYTKVNRKSWQAIDKPSTHKQKMVCREVMLYWFPTT